MVGVEPGLGTPGRHLEAQARHYRATRERVAGRRRERVAPPVHRAYIARILHPRPGRRRCADRSRSLASVALVRPGIAWRRHLGKRRSRVDIGSPRARVALRQQALHGNVDVIGVAVVGVAVRVGQAQGLRDQVDVLGRVVAQGRQVVVLEHLERLGDDGALAPRPTRVDGVVTGTGPPRAARPLRRIQPGPAT